MAANEGCLAHFVGKRGRTPPQNEELEIASKNKLRTIQHQIFEKIKSNQPELEFTGSYTKRVYYEGVNKLYYVVTRRLA